MKNKWKQDFFGTFFFLFSFSSVCRQPSPSRRFFKKARPAFASPANPVVILSDAP
ncbi:MAG: hypothetical protein Q4B32_01080 [Clostridia bacterium]|nr:hypothetical protein [Clostridia bacterium]